MELNDMDSIPPSANLRDYFAGIALQSLLNAYIQQDDEEEEAFGLLGIARQAYLISDAMLLARDMPDIEDVDEELVQESEP